jgi:hypothetical protein
VLSNGTNRFNNPDKGAVTHAIVHRALWEYLLAVNDTPDEAEREKLRREMFERFVLTLIPLSFPSCLIVVLIAVKMSWPRWYIRKMEVVSSVISSSRAQRK